MKNFNKIAIVGIGLIGASVAKAIKRKQVCNSVVGFFRNKTKLKKALENKIVDKGYLDLNQAISGADLVILALPIEQIKKFMLKINKILKSKNTIVIDVGSTKTSIIQIADKLDLNFVGTHPLAGSEKRGMDFATNNLFKDSRVIITPSRKTCKKSLKKIINFWKRLEAKISILTPQHHDKVLSYASHLPHIISFCIMNSVPEKFLQFGASGLKDSTRIAASDPQIWTDIIKTNKKEILNSLKYFVIQLKKLQKAINKNSSKELLKFISDSKNKRERLNFR